MPMYVDMQFKDKKQHFADINMPFMENKVK